MKIARSILPNVGLSAVLVALAFPAAVAAAAHDLTELPLEDLLKVEVVSASKYPQTGAAAPSTKVARRDGSGRPSAPTGIVQMQPREKSAKKRAPSYAAG